MAKRRSKQGGVISCSVAYREVELVQYSTYTGGTLDHRYNYMIHLAPPAPQSTRKGDRAREGGNYIT